MSCVRAGSVIRGFCKGECAVSVVSYGSDILGYVTVVIEDFVRESVQ